MYLYIHIPLQIDSDIDLNFYLMRLLLCPGDSPKARHLLAPDGDPR